MPWSVVIAKRRWEGAHAVLGFVASTVIDLALFAVAFRLSTAAQLMARQVLPGPPLVAAFWLGLQACVGVFVTRLLAGGYPESYGGCAAVIGLLFWLLIASELILIAVELNVVLVHRAWPRSLGGELLGRGQSKRCEPHPGPAQIDRPAAAEVELRTARPVVCRAGASEDDGSSWLAEWWQAVGDEFGAEDKE